MDEFPLLDDVMFDKYAYNRKVTVDNISTGMCPDCPGSIMVIHLSEYKCPHCLRTEPADIREMDIVSGEKRSMRRQFTNYAKSQRDTVAKLLLENNEKYKGDKFQKDILNDVADQYNMIQTQVSEDIYTDGKVTGTKKFVKRSNVKNEIIAALVFFECNRRNIPRKPKDIANFMCLSSDGFSAGEDVIRKLVAEDKIYIDISEEPYGGFVARYLETLDIENSDYIDFTVDLIEEADKRRLGMNSLPPSKVAGCIWIIVNCMKLEISIDKVESTCDNTKKNTFVKFYKVIKENANLFLHIFQKYGIPIIK